LQADQKSPVTKASEETQLQTATSAVAKSDSAADAFVPANETFATTQVLSTSTPEAMTEENNPA